MNQNKTENSLDKNNCSECVVVIDKTKFKVGIVHIGKGRFKIVKDEKDRHVGKIIDASDVIHCRAD